MRFATTVATVVGFVGCGSTTEGDVSPADCGGSLDDCSTCLASAGHSAAAVAVDAAVAVERAAVEIDRTLARECVAWAGPLRIDPGGEVDSGTVDASTACGPVAAYVRDTLSSLAPETATFAITEEPPICRVSRVAARACVDRCGGGEVDCSGREVGACDGRLRRGLRPGGGLHDDLRGRVRRDLSGRV